MAGPCVIRWSLPSNARSRSQASRGRFSVKQGYVNDTERGGNGNGKVDSDDSTDRAADHQGENGEERVHFEFVSHHVRRNAVVHLFG